MNLSSAQQRALIQLIESMIITAIIAGIFSIAPLIESDGPLDWGKIGLFFLFAVIFSLAHSAVAYFKTTNLELGTVLEQVVNALGQRYRATPLQGAQNSAIRPVGQSTSTGYPNIPATVQPRQNVTTAPNQSLVDTAPRPIVQPPIVPPPDQQQ